MEQTEFREWCIIELMGHQHIAGMVSEQSLGGESFIRVDVPDVENMKGYTKMYGKGAIYAITPTDEATCKVFIANTWQPPVSRFLLMPPGTVPDDDSDDM